MTSAPARDLGFTSLTDNISTSPSTSRKACCPAALPAPLTNMVNTSEDTQMMDVPTEGTIESGGING